MSELKAFNSERIYWAVEQVERVAGDIDTLHLDDNLFYIKSEADKVIAEKDKEISKLERQIEFLKITHDACGNCSKCADGMGKVFEKNLNELKAQKAQAEDDCAYWKNLAQKRNLTQPPDRAEEK